MATSGACIRQHVVDDLHGVVLHDADVGEILFANALEQSAHARFMDLAAQKIVVGTHARNVCGGLAHSKPDFKHQRGAAPKNGSRVEWGRCVGHDKPRPQILKRLGLACGGAACSSHKTFDGLGMGHACGSSTRGGRCGCRRW